jgi:hypothetical protein
VEGRGPGIRIVGRRASVPVSWLQWPAVAPALAATVWLSVTTRTEDVGRRGSEMDRDAFVLYLCTIVVGIREG